MVECKHLQEWKRKTPTANRMKWEIYIRNYTNKTSISVFCPLHIQAQWLLELWVVQCPGTVYLAIQWTRLLGWRATVFVRTFLIFSSYKLYYKSIIFSKVYRNAWNTLFLLISFSALRIHVSQSTADILFKTGYFELEERGDIEIKV